jgi:tRNA threonylcarbamoyladenosine biosynthesis protein TsaE
LRERCVTYDTASDQETIHLGQELGKVLKEGDVIALVGELGSGKTWFTKGLALGLGVSPDTIITSPSFSLITEYEGRHTLFHLDVYRLESLSDFLSVGLEDYFYQDGVVVMEWADRWPEILPAWKLKVGFVIIDNSLRKITLSGNHYRAVEILKDLTRVNRDSEAHKIETLEI